MKRIRSFLLPAVAVFLLGACADDSDQGQPRTKCGVGLYERESGAKLSVKNLTVRAIGADSVFVKNETREAFSVPLRYVGDSTQFVLARGTYIPDTLTIVHKNIPRFISMDAGYAMYYELKKVYFTRHTIDTLIVNSATINTHEQENISIYYFPDPEL